MIELIICSEAETDFYTALKWYADRSADAAANFDEEVSRAIAAIALDPERLPKCDNRHRFYLLKKFPFQIIFRRDGASWTVVSMAHTARESEFWKHR